MSFEHADSFDNLLHSLAEKTCHMYLPLKTSFCVSNARITFSLITWQLVMHCVSVKLIYANIQKCYRQRQNRIIQEIHDESKHIQLGHT